eukprot:CAMPEP_0184487564 /NCGR_PEP_ID=MMETSP0113_2-20130426/10195_1 /TAXON_ID=91329 /ORGANISM="Norrisiella sphaerica, Strain BC52" /LENGTH=124 /DNA_ID=CAMNT_0026869919 /DNA_START=24 /DNA_END=398 /DNA_ORIENTATION=-
MASSSLQLKRGVRQLWKKINKALPVVLEQYEFTTFDINKCKTNLKKHFIKHYNETNPAVIDMLRVKGELDLDETVRMFKTPCHIEKFLLKDIDEPQFGENKAVEHSYEKIAGGSEFMKKFYQGA